MALLKDGAAVEELKAGESGEVVLEATPFYAESGGQVGDAGELAGAGMRFVVSDTVKRGTAFCACRAGWSRAASASARQLGAQVDAARRAATVLNHSATHLLHAALRQVLGTHVQQKGSLVAPDRLRFDFSHFQAVTPQELTTHRAAGECADPRATSRRRRGHGIRAGGRLRRHGAVRREIRQGRARAAHRRILRWSCAAARMSSRAGDIGLFKIISESGVASGVRRIEAITGERAIDYMEQHEALIREVAGQLRGSRDEVPDKVRDALERVRQMEREIRTLKDKLASGSGVDLAAGAVDVQGVKVVAAQVDGADSGALRNAVDQLKSRLGSAVIVLGSVDAQSKVLLVAGVTADQTARVKAGELVGMRRRAGRWQGRWPGGLCPGRRFRCHGTAAGARRALKRWFASVLMHEYRHIHAVRTA